MKNQIFKNEEFGQIRTCTMNGETYFVGKDVASALGYKNTMDALMRHVDEEDKQTSGFTMGSHRYSMTVVNESGLYSLILSSKLDSARRFKRWVTSEILPAIRKNGHYELEQRTRKLENRNTLLEEISAQQKPAVRVNELLKHLHIQHKVGGQWILYAPHIGKGYVQSFSSYFVQPDGEVQVKLHTRWTQSGRLFLYEELKRAAVLPLIELG